jgi:hypothetical protein
MKKCYISGKITGLTVMEPDKLRKLICKLMGLPEWYYSDKDGLCREILKLF